MFQVFCNLVCPPIWKYLSQAAGTHIQGCTQTCPRLYNDLSMAIHELVEGLVQGCMQTHPRLSVVASFNHPALVPPCLPALVPFLPFHLAMLPVYHLLPLPLSALTPSCQGTLVPSHPPALVPSYPCTLPTYIFLGCEGARAQGAWGYGEDRGMRGTWVWGHENSCSVEVSQLHPSTNTTPSTFTEWQMAFVGHHHGPSILGQKDKPAAEVTLNEPPKKCPKTTFLETRLLVQTSVSLFSIKISNIEKLLNESLIDITMNTQWIDYSIFEVP